MIYYIQADLEMLVTADKYGSPNITNSLLISFSEIIVYVELRYNNYFQKTRCYYFLCVCFGFGKCYNVFSVVFITALYLVLKNPDNPDKSSQIWNIYFWYCRVNGIQHLN